ncbi:MAG: bacteriocin class II family protein, partial [Woeseiaceae bacterium]
QDSTQQSKDEAECYNWAVENTGKDPFELLKQQEEKSEQTDAQIEAAEDAQGRNGTVVRGAAAGAIVGEVTGGDAGESAAIGAAVGIVAQRRRNRAAHQQAAAVEEQAAASEQATEQEVEKFMNGFTACLEAKDYVAKY